jgi:hypothetical protein
VAVSMPLRRRAELASVIQPLRHTAERISRAISLAS